jgi:hypothetical protein
MEQLGTIIALMQSGMITKVTAAEPSLKSDIDTIVADIELLGNLIIKISQRTQKLLADAKPILDSIGDKGTT